MLYRKWCSIWEHDMKKNVQMHKSLLLYALALATLVGCSTSRTSYQREYNRVWREMVKSDAWKKSLEEPVSQDLYASVDGDVILAPEETLTAARLVFENQYLSLVSLAYSQIIAEAEAADARIALDYRNIKQTEEKALAVNDKAFKQRKELVFKKYKAHTAMLSGLKSWNIFSDERSGDLDYFMAENRKKVAEMKHAGESNDQIVNFLIYKLADLYHLEE